jgi:hypothetical protein
MIPLLLCWLVRFDQPTSTNQPTNQPTDRPGCSRPTTNRPWSGRPVRLLFVTVAVRLPPDIPLQFYLHFQPFIKHSDLRRY